MKYAITQLKRDPETTCTIILAMVIGMVVTTSTYTFVNSVLLRPFPYRDQERLAALWQSSKETPKFVVAPANFLDWKRQSSTFSGMTAIQEFKDRSFAMSDSGQPEEIDGVRVTWDIFKVLDVTPIHGRSFVPTEQKKGRNAVALISYGLWMRKFGGSASVIGKPIVLNRQPTEIIGVLPKGFELPLIKADVFMPVAWDEREAAERSIGGYLVIGRLKSGVSFKAARAELDIVAKRIERDHPETNTGETILVEPLHETIVGDIRPTLLTLFVASCLLLVLGSASVSNLLLACLSERRNEIAIRASVGATPYNIFCQFLTEALVITSIAGTIALVLAKYAVHALLALAPDTTYFSIPRRGDIAIDTSVFLFALAVISASGIAVGLVPAWVASKEELNTLLKDGGRGVSGKLHGSIRQALMGVQITLALLLVMGSCLTLKSLVKIESVDPGLNSDRVLTGEVSLPISQYPLDAQVTAFYRQLTSTLSSAPGIESVALINFPPLSGVASMWSFHVVGQPVGPESQWPAALHAVVTPNYMQTVGIPLRLGRYFSEKDNSSGRKVALISNAFANKFFKRVDPIGKLITIRDGGSNPREIVGVVGDVRSLTLVRAPMPQVYVPFDQLPQHVMTLVVRSLSEETELPSMIRREVSKIDKDRPVSKFRSLRELVSSARSRYLVSTVLLLTFGFSAAVISLIGIYGLTAYATSRRKHEISSRYALGATLGSVLRILVREAVLIAVVGTIAGLLLSWMLTRLLGAILFGVQARDPIVFALVATGTIALSFVCATFSAYRLARAEPIDTLRSGS